MLTASAARRRQPDLRRLTRGILAVVALAAAPGAFAAPAQEAADRSNWVTARVTPYGVTLRHPPTLVPASLTETLQPPPLVRVGLRPAALTHPTGMEPPSFAVDVYDNARRLPLDDWLAGSGMPVPASSDVREAATVGGVSALRIVSRTLAAPNTFYFVARGAFVYRFTPLGADGDGILATVRFAEP